MENLDGTTKRLMSDPADRRFEFQKSRQLFLRVYNETFSVVAMCVSYARHNSPAKLTPRTTRGL